MANQEKHTTTPAESRYIMAQLSSYLKPHLAFLLTIKHLTKGTANACYQAYNEMWRIAVLLEKLNLDAGYVIDLLEHLLEKREAEQLKTEQIIETAA